MLLKKVKFLFVRRLLSLSRIGVEFYKMFTLRQLLWSYEVTCVSLLIWCTTLIFRINLLCMPGIKPTWSGCNSFHILLY